MQKRKDGTCIGLVQTINMKTTALIEKGKDGTFGIFTPDIETTIIGEGRTVEEAKADFENSVMEVFQSYEGEEMPEELKGISFEYKYDVASVFNYLDCINVSKLAKRIGMNASLLRQYRSGKTYISESQAAKIEKGLHVLGKEPLTVSL